MKYDEKFTCFSDDAKRPNMNSLLHDDACMKLQWRHNKRDAISNRRRIDCLLNRLLRRKWKKTHQNYASLAFVRGIQRWAVNSPHKGPETRKVFPFDDIFMINSKVWDVCTTSQQEAKFENACWQTWDVPNNTGS